MAKAATAAELRGLSRGELNTKVTELKEELFTLRFQAATGQLESHGRLRAVRKDIARIYTVLQERELGIVDDPTLPRPPTEKVEAEMSESEETVADAAADAADAERGRRKVREGYVVSDKMDKTIVVAVEDRVKHRLYGKVLRQTSRLKAHDETNSAGVGDRVRIMETRPLSATKRWRLVEILEKAK